MAAVKSADKMMCPQCGFQMNHHGDKLVYGASSQESQDTSEIESLSGGLITQFHSCPNCGSAASRNT